MNFKDHMETEVLCYGWVSSEILFSNGNIPDIESKIRGIFHEEKGFTVSRNWGTKYTKHTCGFRNS